MTPGRNRDGSFQWKGLSITRFDNELIILYTGKKKVYMKKLDGFGFLLSRTRKGPFFRRKTPLEKKLKARHKINREHGNSGSIRFLQALLSFFRMRGREVVVGVLLVSLSAFLLSRVPERDSSALPSDEERKNELLTSEGTDFSNPEKKDPLSIKTHTVSKGETLSEIARIYGVSMDTICGSNELRSYDFIQVGMKLQVPNRDGILHNMKKGERITSLATKYKIPMDKIIAENDLVNPDFIQDGSMVFIPDAKPNNIIKGFMWPTATRYITSGYGWRRHPFNRSRRQFHNGLDIRARYEYVRASKYGKVTFAGWLGGYGRAVIIAHPGGWKTLYAHLSRTMVRPGQYVKQGQIIARSGNTGRSTGPHLHFEILKNGRHLNPYRYLHR